MPATKHALPAPQLAKLAGVSLTTWKEHVRDGAPTPRRKSDVKAWLVKYHEWRKLKKPGPGAPASARSVDDYWTTERKKYLALRSKLDLLHARGLLVKRSEVVAFATAAFGAVGMRLNDLVKKMAVRLFQAPSVEWIEEQLRTEVDSIRRGLENGLEVPAHEDPVADDGPDDLADLDAETAGDG
jgi:hypothetical protein